MNHANFLAGFLLEIPNEAIQNFSKSRGVSQQAFVER